MRLTVDLPPDTSSLVEEALRSGDFPNPTAMVVAALHAMRGQREDLLGYTADELRRLGDEGEASRQAEEIDFEAVKREARRQAS